MDTHLSDCDRSISGPAVSEAVESVNRWHCVCGKWKLDENATSQHPRYACGKKMTKKS